MVDTARSLGEPQLVFQATIERKPYRRRFWFSLLVIAATIGAWYALDTAGKRGLVDSRLTDIGWLAAAAVVALMTIRAVISLIRWLTRKNEMKRCAFTIRDSPGRETVKNTSMDGANCTHCARVDAVSIWGDARCCNGARIR
jgi:hypothetical protein